MVRCLSELATIRGADREGNQTISIGEQEGRSECLRGLFVRLGAGPTSGLPTIRQPHQRQGPTPPVTNAIGAQTTRVPDAKASVRR